MTLGTGYQKASFVFNDESYSIMNVLLYNAL